MYFAMSLAKSLADKISVPTQSYEIEDLNEQVEFAQLSINGLAEVNKRLDINLWEHILETFSGELSEVQEGATKEEAMDNINQQAMVNFLKGLDYKLQIELAWESLKQSLGKETTRNQADKIYSHGLNDDQQMQALMFILQGVQEEEVEERANKSEGDSGNQTILTSEEEE